MGEGTAGMSQGWHAFLDTLIESSADLFLVVDGRGVVTRASRSIELTLGRPLGQVIGRRLDALADPRDASLIEDHLAAIYRGGHTPTSALTFRFPRTGGEPDTLHSKCIRMIDAAGDVSILVHAPVIDILNRSEQRFRIVSELASDFAYSVAVLPDGTLEGEWATEAMPRITGYHFHELDIAGWAQLVHPEDHPIMRRRLSRLMAGEPDISELRIVNRSGELRWLIDKGRPEIDESGRVIRIYGAARDITERKRAEELTSALLDVATAISGSLDFQEILARVQRRTADVLSCDIVATFCVDRQDGVMKMIAQHGMNDEQCELAQLLAMPLGQPFGGIVEGGGHVVINNPREQPWVPAEFYEFFNIGAIAIVPLTAAGRYVGSIAAINLGDGRPFLEPQVTLLAGIARQLAVALETTQLYRHQQEESEISAALARVSHQLIAWLDRPSLLDRFGRMTCEILECDSSYTMLRRDDGAYVPIHSHGHPGAELEPDAGVPFPASFFAPAERALENDDAAQLKPAEFPDSGVMAAGAASGVRSALFMALRSGDDLTGLQIACLRRGDGFSERKIRIARGMAQLASLALRNAQLVHQLERANQLKTDFVATMSHELRTPLNIVIGYNDLMRERVFGEINAEQEDALERMQTSASNLLRLIDSTLDLSRLETGEMRLDLKRVDLGDLLGEIEREREESRPRPFLTIEWPRLDHVWLRTDRPKLKVILKNLIGNAIKFTERGHVRIGAAVVGEAVEIVVEDSGIGIAPEVLPVIFEPFRQGDSSDTRNYGGVGLGLYIVRRLIDLLRGTIAVESEKGRGTTFRVRLPRAL